MSVFGKILERLGLRRSSTASQSPTAPPSSPGGSATPGSATHQGAPSPQGSTTAPRSSAQDPTVTKRPEDGSAAAKPVAMVDVVGHLEDLAAKNPQKLNWKTSIVDLLKLLDLDSSPTARRELAQELGAPSNLKDGSGEMNMWLHRTVLRKIAENGGNVPPQLLD